MDVPLLLCIASGFVLGAISGLVPGLHLNNFAAMLLAISPYLLEEGITPFQMASIILAASIAQTFFDSVPAIFLGAPDSDAVLAVLPGHRLMLEGRGIEAVRLSALGSAASTVVSLMLIPPLSWFFSRYYEGLSGYIGLLLLGIALLMLRSERGPLIEGQGSLAHWKYRGLASLIFLTSGCLGIFAFENEGLLSSPLGVEPEVLLPLLSGLFGAPSLLLSMTTTTRVPEQQGSEIDLQPGRLARAVIAGSLGGSVVAWIPGISPSVAAITARLGSPSSSEEFLVSIAGVNTANALFSLVALYVIQRPRSGAAAAIRELVALDQGILVQMMMVVVLVAFVSYLAVIGTACIAARAMPRLNYRRLCSGVLALLAGMTAAFTGPFGLLIFLLSTVAGLIAPLAGVHRIHAMGVLMLPLILQYI